MNHFVMRHRRLVLILYPIFCSLPILYLFWEIGTSFFWGLLWVAVCIITSFGFVNSCILKEHKKIMEQLDRTCDPHVALQQIEELLCYTKSKLIIQALTINKALCLKELGKQDQSFALLKEINIDQFPGVGAAKIVYYNNLCCAYIDCENLAVAEFLLEKCVQLLQNQTLKQAEKVEVETTLKLNHMELAVKNGKPEGAYELYQKAIQKAATNRSLANTYFTMGELYLKQGHKSEAKECFTYTVQYGNRLFCAAQAKKQLEGLSKEA